MNTTEPKLSPTPKALKLTLAMLLLMLVLAALDQTIVSTALPSMAKDLGGTARMSWVFSAYLISSTVAVPLYGKLADLHGAKPVLLVAVGLFLLGSVLCGASRDMNELILSRGLQGAGGGGLLTLAMMAVVRIFPAESRSRLQGLLGATYGLSIMFGPLVGGYLVEHASWRWSFFINLPVGLLAWAVLARNFPKVAAVGKGRMDYLGAVLLSAALVSLLMSTRPADPGQLPAVAWAALGGVLVVAFVWAQARVRSPLLPLSLFAQHGFSAAMWLSAAGGFALFAVVVFIPQYFQIARGLSPASSGWQSMPLMAGVTVASIASGRRLAKTGQVRGTAVLACAVAAVAFALLGLLLRSHTPSLAWVSVCLFPLGMGIGALFPLVTVVAQISAPLPLMGIATASPVMFRTVAGAVGVSVLAALFTHEMARELALHAVGVSPQTVFGLALSEVFGVSAAVSAVACVAAWRMPVRLARPETGDEKRDGELLGRVGRVA